jgi:transcriptional regulator with XRE-family HTH domain
MKNRDAVNPVRIGRTLRGWREQLCLTQRDFAARIQARGARVDRTHIARLESGRMQARLDTLAVVCTVLDREIRELFTEGET